MSWFFSQSGGILVRPDGVVSAYRWRLDGENSLLRADGAERITIFDKKDLTVIDSFPAYGAPCYSSTIPIPELSVNGFSENS